MCIAVQLYDYILIYKAFVHFQHRQHIIRNINDSYFE